MPELTQIKLVNGVTYDIADAKCRDNMPKSLIDLKEDAKSVHVTQYEKNKWNGINEKMPFNFGVDGDKYGYYNSKGELIPFGSSEEQPFKLGIDDKGNYGYIKNGETDVTPFVQSPSGGTLKFTKLFEVRNASNSNIIKDEYDEYHMELSFEGDGDGGFRLEDTVSMIGKTSNKMICKDSNGKRVIYNFNTGKVSFPDGGYGTDNGTPVNARPEGNYKWLIIYNSHPNTDIYVDGECYIIRQSSNRNFYFVTSKDVTTLNFWQNDGSGLKWSSSHPTYATYGNCNVFFREEYSTMSDLAYYVDFVTDDYPPTFIQNNLNLFTDENGIFTIKNPWKVTMYGITKSSTSSNGTSSNIPNHSTEEIIALLASAGYVKAKSVPTLPSEAGSNMDTIYLIQGEPG